MRREYVLEVDGVPVRAVYDDECVEGVLVPLLHRWTRMHAHQIAHRPSSLSLEKDKPDDERHHHDNGHDDGGKHEALRARALTKRPLRAREVLDLRVLVGNRLALLLDRAPELFGHLGGVMGRTVKNASVSGSRHGIQTSLDADFVTLVTALALFFVGTGTVKGFGLTLALGVACDIVTMQVFPSRATAVPTQASPRFASFSENP